MELESSYQLLGVLRDDGIRTYNAVEISTGQALQVHLFGKSDSLDLFKALRALPLSKRRELLEVGMQGDQPYVVTEKLPDNTTARDWLVRLAGLPPVRVHGPVVLAGSWKTGTPLPDDLLRASQSALPPKYPAQAPKPAETPDYTRVMRLPSVLPVEPQAPAAAAPDPVPASTVPPLPEPPPLVPAPEPEPLFQADGQFKPEAQLKAEAPPELDEFDRLFPSQSVPANEPQPGPQVGTFTGMFLAAQAAQAAQAPAASPPEPIAAPAPEPPPVVVAPEPVPVPAPEPPLVLADPEPIVAAAPEPPPIVPKPEAVPEPVASEPVVTPPPPVPHKEPGEFTSKFLAASHPAEPPPPPTAPSPSNGPGEFTQMFLRAQAESATKAPPEPGEFTSQFLRPPQPPPSAPTPLPIPIPMQPAPLPSPTPLSEEKTRLFPAFSPTGPPPGPSPAASPTPTPQPLSPIAKQPGEFTNMFPPVRSDAPGLPPPPAKEGPSEFTGFYQSPMYPEANNQRLPNAPAPTPQAPRPSAQPSEFTMMFGDPAKPKTPSAPPPAFGSSASATGAVSIPSPSHLPPPKSSQPGEFTQMMSVAAAQPTLGQPPPGKAAAPAAEPQAKSKLPLILGGVAVFLVIVLLIVLFFFSGK